ncbi:fasciclin [Gordonia iterans]|uniref:Fasciclin n=1 Tax=Gordonia iterans TaxID=1004901 RepID=A0A2S0KHH9_9ACTN|nr:fasciclin domain-containing protein [Gordonia iterans]AVM01134.1 fasciclin [Gordonia iterans]
MSISRNAGTVAAAAAVLAIGLTACGNDDSTTSEATSRADVTSSALMTSMPAADSGLIGPGCAAYADANPTGSASLAALAGEPVATAAGNVPMLSTLTAALSGGVNPGVNLVSTLNEGQFTVFAPVDEAFAEIDQATMDTLKTDSALLTGILTYHVVPGQVAPEDAVGTHKTVQGADLTVTSEGDDVKVNDASVICGGIQTKNAKVYLIDEVLMPPTS